MLVLRKCVIPVFTDIFFSKFFVSQKKKNTKTTKRSIIISLSCHEQVYLMRLLFERYFSRRRVNYRGSISRNVALLNILVHVVINL